MGGNANRGCARRVVNAFGQSYNIGSRIVVVGKVTVFTLNAYVGKSVFVKDSSCRLCACKTALSIYSGVFIIGT